MHRLHNMVLTLDVYLDIKMQHTLGNDKSQTKDMDSPTISKNSEYTTESPVVLAATHLVE